MDELQSSQYLKATYQSSGGLIHLSGWHPNRFEGRARGREFLQAGVNPYEEGECQGQRSAGIQIRSGSVSL